MYFYVNNIYQGINKSDKLNKLKRTLAPYARILILVTVFSSYMLSLAASQTGGGNTANLTNALCNVAKNVFSVIFVLGLMLMIIGAAMYASAHILPGQTKGSLQGYGMGMIIGGVVGVILALLANPILSVVIGASGEGLTNAGCPSLI
jgi:hypothetical protein